MTTSDDLTAPPEDLEEAPPGDAPKYEALTSEGRLIVRTSLLTLAVLSTGSMIGTASSFYLINEYPLVLLVLSPIGRHLVLTAPIVDPLLFVGIGTVRRMLFYFPCFMLGRTLGARGLEWIATRAPSAERFLRWLETVFERARYPAVFFLIGPMMSTIAGNSGMNVRVWAVLVAGGLVFRMILTIWFGEWMREPIEWVLAFMDEYRFAGTITMILGIVAYQLWSRRRS